THPLRGAHGPSPLHRALAQFPPSLRDPSFFIDRTVPAADILAAVRGSGAPNLELTDIFDVYEGKGLPEGKRSVAISMTFCAEDRTLTDAEVEVAQASVIAALEGKLGAQIRRA